MSQANVLAGCRSRIPSAIYAGAITRPVVGAESLRRFTRGR